MITLFAAENRLQSVGAYNKDFVLSPRIRGFMCRLNISAVTLTPTVDLKFQIWDQARDTFEDLLDWSAAPATVAFAQQAGAIEIDLVLYPSLTVVSANRRVSGSVNGKVRAVHTIGNAAGDEAFTSAILMPLY